LTVMTATDGVRPTHPPTPSPTHAPLQVVGMGRAIHTNLNASMRCDFVRLAMIKNSRVADKLFGGAVYDCIFKYDSV